MVTLNEFLEGKDLFTAIKYEGNFEFIPDDDIPAMNGLLLLENGLKEIYFPAQVMGLNTLAGLIAVKFNSKWEGYIKAEAVLQNINVRRELTENVSNDETRNNISNDINKVSAFNSDEMVDDTGNERTSTDTNNNDRERVVVDETIDPSKAYNMLGRVSKDGIINKVISDVSGFLTLSIY